MLDSESSSDDDSDNETSKNRKAQQYSTCKAAHQAKSSTSIVCGRQTVFHVVSQPKRSSASSSDKQKPVAKTKRPTEPPEVTESKTQSKKFRKDSEGSSSKTSSVSKADTEVPQQQQQQQQLKRWSCTLCPMTSDYIESMKRHLETRHRIAKIHVNQYVSERTHEKISQADGETETTSEQQRATSPVAASGSNSVATSSNSSKQKRNRSTQVNFDEDSSRIQAEEIEKLRAERDRYKKERDRLKKTVEGFKSFHMDMWERANKELSRLS